MDPTTKWRHSLRTADAALHRPALRSHLEATLRALDFGHNDSMRQVGQFLCLLHDAIIGETLVLHSPLRLHSPTTVLT